MTDFANSETDPMLGDEDTQKAYKAWIADIIRQNVEETRAARRLPASTKENDPVMIGAVGFSGNLNSATGGGG